MVDTATAMDHPAHERASDPAPPPRSVAVRLLDRAVRVIHILAALGIFVIMLHVIVNVTSRYLFNRPIPFSTEIIGYIELPIVGLLGFIVAQHLKEHLQAPLVFDQLTWGNRRILVVVATLLTAAVSLGFAYYLLENAIHGWEIGITAGVSSVEIWPVLFLFPIVFLILAIYYIVEAVQAIRGHFDDKSEMELAGEGFDIDLEATIVADAEQVATTPAPKSSRAERSAARDVARAARTALAAVKRRSRKPTWAVFVLLGAAVINIVLIFVVPTRELVGAASLAFMVLLLFFRVPIAFTLITPAILGMYSLYGERAVATIMVDGPEGALTQYLFSTLPMFILMGMLLASSGIADRVYDACRLWIGRIPGGIGVATNVAGGGMAAISGSTMGTAYTLARIGVPQMLKDGYDRRLAVGTVIAASLPGQIVPPSLSLIIMTGITGAAVGPQLLAGIVPGIGMVVVMAALIITIATVLPRMAGRAPDQIAAKRAAGGEPEKVTWGQRFRSLGAIWPLVVMFIAIFGSLYGGLLTATEAGAAGAFVASLLVLFFRRKDKPFRYLLEGAMRAVSTVGAIFLVIIGALMLTKLIAVTGLGRLFSDMVLDLGLDRIGFLLIVMIVYFLLGTFMEPLPIFLLTIPILQPVFEPLGIDILWFGVFAVIMGEIAILSPPIGILTFLVHGLVQDRAINLGQRITLADVYNATWMLMPGFVVLLLAMIFFPEFVTWLPYSGQGG